MKEQEREKIKAKAVEVANSFNRNISLEEMYCIGYANATSEAKENYPGLKAMAYELFPVNYKTDFDQSEPESWDTNEVSRNMALHLAADYSGRLSDRISQLEKENEEMRKEIKAFRALLNKRYDVD